MSDEDGILDPQNDIGDAFLLMKALSQHGIPYELTTDESGQTHLYFNSTTLPEDWTWIEGST